MIALVRVPLHVLTVCLSPSRTALVAPALEVAVPVRRAVPGISVARAKHAVRESARYDRKRFSA